MRSQELDRREVQSVEGAHGSGERLEGSLQHEGLHLDDRNSRQYGARSIAMTRSKTTSLDASPHFVVYEAARHQGLGPEGLGRHSILGEEVSQDHRGVGIDQRSWRS